MHDAATTALQTFTRPVDEAHVPALAQRVRRGQRAFIAIATTGLSSWALSYILAVHDSLSWLIIPYLVPQAIAIAIAASPRAEHLLTHTLLALLLLLELNWALFNAYIGPVEIFTHALAFSLPCFIALFVPLAPRYLAASGAIMLWLDTLNMVYGADVHPTYLAAQISVGVLCVLLGMAASQRQRLLYLQIQRDTLLRAREHSLAPTNTDHAEPILPLLTSRCNPDAPRALRAHADAHTITLHLIGQWPEDATRRLNADLALCADRARALFEGDLRFLDARTLQLQLSRAEPLADPTPTPHFTPGFAALAQGKTP
jgi:hypothetical protein